MPEKKRTPRRYLTLDKEKGGLKEKLEGDRVYNMAAFGGQLTDFRFRDNEYNGRVSRQLEIEFADVNESGEPIQVILRTGSGVWIDGFLNLVANAPGPGNLGREEHLSVGAFRPNDKEYLYCWMTYDVGASEQKVVKLYDADQTMSWCADPYKPTDEEQRIKEERLIAAAVRWRRQHLSVPAEMQWLDKDGRVRATFDDSAYVPPAGAQAGPVTPAAEPASEPAKAPEGEVTYANFVEAVRESQNPLRMTADKVRMADRDKARSFLEHYQRIWNAISETATPETEVDLLKAKTYKSGSWPNVVDHVYNRLLALGLISPPVEQTLPGENDSLDSLDDDLPF